MEVLFRYNHREFTQESDALNGMAGILRHISRNVGGSTLEGLPTACFDYSLIFWHQFGLPKRREMFPSWSWAGWSGHTVCITMHEGFEVGEWITSSTYVVWFKRLPLTGDVERVWEAPALRMGQEENAREPPYIPTPLVVSEDEVPYGYHLLQFWSCAVEFPGRLLYKTKDNRAAVIYDGANGGEVGRILLDDQDFDLDDDGPFEFILLSQWEASALKNFWGKCLIGGFTGLCWWGERVLVGFTRGKGWGIFTGIGCLVVCRRVWFGGSSYWRRRLG